MFDARACFLSACLSLVVLSADATPYPGYYYPSSLQVGTKTRVLVGGVAMGGVKSAYITGTGVEVKRIVCVPGFPRAMGKTQSPWIVNWMYDILEGKDLKHRKLPPEALLTDTDWAECTWWPYLDERDDIELQIVARDRFTPESYPQATPALDQILLLDMEVSPTAEPGRRDIILCDGHSASAPHAFFITKEPHVAEKFFVIPSREVSNHRKLPRDLHLPTPLPALRLPIYIDGQAWPGETDQYTLRLTKGQHLVCALTGRELMPYQGDAVPGWFNPELRLYDATGHRVAEADDFYYLPDPVLTYTVPEDGDYTLEICDNLYRGRQDCVYFIHCYAAATDRPQYTPKERAFICFPPAAAHEPPKPADGRILKTGTIDYPGRVIRHFIEIREPGSWKFELFARRQGSPLDGVLKLYGPMGSLPLSAAPKCAEWDDELNRLYELKNVGDNDKPIIKTNMLFVGSVTQGECDPVGRWTFTEPGKYCVTVSDRAGFGDEHYDYTLSMEPLKPSFEVYSAASAFVSTPGGQAARFKAYLLRRDGFDAPITFDSTDEFEVSGGFYDPEEIETQVTVTSLKKDWSGVKLAQLTASGELPSGEKVTVRVTPCDPAEQAFAYTHLLPQSGFFFCAPGEDVREAEKHPLPHLGDGKTKTSHSNGQSCVTCHKVKKGHGDGKACATCHKGKN